MASPRGCSTRFGCATLTPGTRPSARMAAGKSRISSRLRQPRPSIFGRRPEDKLPDALAAVDDGSLLGNSEHMATIRDAIALHVARSVATRIVHFRTFIQVAAASRNLWLTDWRPWLEAAFYQAKGF